MDTAEALTVAQWLHDAFERRRRPDWPQGFDACMRSPMHARLILQEAEHPAHRAPIAVPDIVRPDPPLVGDSSPVMKAVLSPVMKRDHTQAATNPQVIDFKSRAAGERPDNDP